MKKILMVLLLLAPWRLRRLLLIGLFGYRIHPRARIGLAVILADRLEMGEGAWIGNLTLCGPIGLLKMGAWSAIGRQNRITGYPAEGRIFFREEAERRPELILEEHAHITDRHSIDCSNSVTVGRFTVFAGSGSQILTHSIDLAESHQRSRPVHIGSYCFVGTGSILLSGSVLPDYSVLGAGAVLNKAYEEPYCLYAGSPARPLKTLPKTLKFFTRATGLVV